jgi:hypothetical protein
VHLSKGVYFDAMADKTRTHIHAHILTHTLTHSLRDLQKAENVRRRHNYVPFVFNLLTLLAKKNQLTGMLTQVERECVCVCVCVIYTHVCVDKCMWILHIHSVCVCVDGQCDMCVCMRVHHTQATEEAATRREAAAAEASKKAQASA